MNECFTSGGKYMGEPASGADDLSNLVAQLLRAPCAAVQLGGSGALWELGKPDDINNFDFLIKTRAMQVRAQGIPAVDGADVFQAIPRRGWHFKADDTTKNTLCKLMVNMLKAARFSRFDSAIIKKELTFFSGKEVPSASWASASSLPERGGDIMATVSSCFDFARSQGHVADPSQRSEGLPNIVTIAGRRDDTDSVEVSRTHAEPPIEGQYRVPAAPSQQSEGDAPAQQGGVVGIRTRAQRHSSEPDHQQSLGPRGEDRRRLSLHQLFHDWRCAC